MPLPEQVGIGVHVEVELIDADGNAERIEFDLVNKKAAAFDQGLLGADTPLGKAIRGKRVGSVVDYVMGDIRRVRVVKIAPAQVDAPEDATARRAALLEEARRKAERTNADMFASSFSGKWGDYSTDDVKDDLTENLTGGADDAGCP